MVAKLQRVGRLNNLEDGGTYDLMFMSFPDGYPESKIQFAIGNTPRKVTGVQKVAQVFLYALMTSKGSDPVRPNFGTHFSAHLSTSNRTDDDQELYSSVREHVADAQAQAQYSLNRSAKDPTSMLRSVDVVKISVEGEYLNIILRLVTFAGESAALAIPFPQLDLKINGR